MRTPNANLMARLLGGAAVLAMCTIQAQGQCGGMSLNQLDQGACDADLLSVSNRVLQRDAGPSTQFDRLYRVPGKPSLLMRRAGAVTAVFPRQNSHYGLDQGNPFPHIPAGTTFYIGEPVIGGDSYDGAEWIDLGPEGQDHSLERASLLISAQGGVTDLGFSLSATNSGDRVEFEPTPIIEVSARMRATRPTVATDEAYRQRRIADLLAEAARNETRRPKSGLAGAQ